MAYLPDQRHWFYVSFALKDSTGATTTINCSNSAEIDDGSTYYPILKSISGVSADMGAYMPLTQGGTIVLDNSPGSFGYERRFSDLLDRLRIIDTEIVIYGARTAIDDTTIVDGFTQIYKARVQRWSYDVEGDSLSIQIASAPVRKQVMTKIVDAVTFTDAPTRALGKHLPVVIGQNVEVTPIVVNVKYPEAPVWGYATTLSTDHEVGGIQNYWARNAQGEFVEVVSAAATSTILAGHANVSGKNHAGYGANAVTAHKFSPADGYILTQVGLRIYKASGTDNGTMRFQMRMDDLVQNQVPFDAPGTVIGETQVQLSGLSSAAGEYDLLAAWDRPVVIAAGVSVYLVYWLEPESGDPTTSPVEKYYDGAITEQAYTTVYTTEPDGLWTAGAALTKQQFWQLYGVVLTDTVSILGDEDGLGYASFTATQAAAPTDYTEPDLTTLDMVVTVNGLLDNGSGDITGVASSLIERPDHALMLLDKEWDGAAWDGASGRIDDTKYSATHAALDASTNRYYRKVAGRTHGRATVEQIMEEVAKNSGVRLALANSTTAGKSLGVYVWGEEISSSATFTDENSRVLSIEQRGTETIVNRVAMHFDLKMRDLKIEDGSAEGGFRNYAQTINWTDGTNSIATALCSESQTVFGVRPLAESAFDWLNDSASAEVMAAYFMSLYGKPHSYVTVEVPMFSAETLEVLSVITIIHPALSAYFGTSSLGKAPSYGGDPGDPGLGQYLKRAKSYRAQIEGKSLYFNLGDIPTIRLTCRILDNYPTDPT